MINQWHKSVDLVPDICSGKGCTVTLSRSKVTKHINKENYVRDMTNNKMWVSHLLIFIYHGWTELGTWIHFRANLPSDRYPLALPMCTRLCSFYNLGPCADTLHRCLTKHDGNSQKEQKKELFCVLCLTEQHVRNHFTRTVSRMWKKKTVTVKLTLPTLLFQHMHWHCRQSGGSPSGPSLTAEVMEFMSRIP